MKKLMLCVEILFALSEFSVLGMSEESNAERKLTTKYLQNLEQSIDKKEFFEIKRLVNRSSKAEQYCLEYCLATRNVGAFTNLQAIYQWPSALDITKYSVKHSEFFCGLNIVTSLLEMHLITENQIRECYLFFVDLYNFTYLLDMFVFP